jgi:hypothetical protein
MYFPLIFGDQQFIGPLIAALHTLYQLLVNGTITARIRRQYSARPDRIRTTSRRT